MAALKKEAGGDENIFFFFYLALSLIYTSKFSLTSPLVKENLLVYASFWTRVLVKVVFEQGYLSRKNLSYFSIYTAKENLSRKMSINEALVTNIYFTE